MKGTGTGTEGALREGEDGYGGGVEGREKAKGRGNREKTVANHVWKLAPPT